MPLYAAVVLIGMARFVETTLGLNYNIALIVMAVLVAVYVVFGGIRGVMYTDALQGTIMFFGMAFLLIATYWLLGGVATCKPVTYRYGCYGILLQQLVQVPLGGHQCPHWAVHSWWTLVSTLISGVGIGVLSQPQLVVAIL